jgi:hypothetical protein
MAYTDAYQDIVTINSVSTGFKAGDLVGETEKTKTPLYVGIKGRLYSSSNQSEFLRTESGKQEKFKYNYGLQVEAQYNGANRGDEVIVNDEVYVITKKQELRGRSPEIHHVIYLLEESK